MQVFGMEGLAVLLGVVLDPLDAAAQSSSTAARDHLVPFVSQAPQPCHASQCGSTHSCHVSIALTGPVPSCSDLLCVCSQAATFLAHAATHDTALLTPHGAVLKHIST